ncbi:MAG: winged helix DNA-binding domain-containing protein [Anaerolineales bacterium]|nr:winged helix DNA-binding domain-containing protein [Anaerolineales bacterium]
MRRPNDECAAQLSLHLGRDATTNLDWITRAKTPRPPNQSTNRPSDQSTNRPIDQPTNRPTDQSTTQPPDPKTMLTIDLPTARRFILGKQGLWPGRRWRGLEGTAQAMRAVEYLQLDPLQVVARSHDIQLHGRILDYTPGAWEAPAYAQRRFFDWGGWLATRPMDELPHWRVVMRRERDGHPDCDPRIRKSGHDHAAAIAEMRAVLRERGTALNRDFDMAERTRTHNYRGRKDSALALYYLWRTGEVMTHHRENFERIYALTETVAPPYLLHESDDATADRFLIQKEISFHGLSRLQRTSDAFQRGVPFSRKKELCAALLAEGAIVEVKIEGWRAVHYALAADAGLLAELSAGRVPAAWAPLDTTTTDEAVFLAPLDPVSARGRARLLFDFDYVWEVYKPADKRRFGYYTLPVLWGDRLVARFDSKLDRATNTFVILGFWLEDEALGQNEAFAAALARGFARFAAFLAAARLDAAAVPQPLLRDFVNRQP